MEKSKKSAFTFSISGTRKSHSCSHPDCDGSSWNRYCLHRTFHRRRSFVQNFDGNYIYSGSYGNEADTWRSLVAASGILAGFLITLIPYCSLVRRIKARNVWKQSFLYCVGHRIVSAGRTFYEGRQESERTILMFCVFYAVYRLFSLCGFGIFGVFPDDGDGCSSFVSSSA